MTPSVRAAVALAVIMATASLAVACSSSSSGNKSETPSPLATSGIQGGGAATATSVPKVNSTSGGTTTVEASLSEFRIGLSQQTVPSGKVTFIVTNKGTMAHQFVILQTDLPDAGLPIDPSTSTVKEDAPGVVLVDQEAAIPAGESAQVSVDLKAGKYVIICNIAGHYTLGMHRALTVTAS
jgi:uncharacterized cupredoxin-like copper-binding protein